jgi:hypothetical protein
MVSQTRVRIKCCRDYLLQNLSHPDVMEFFRIHSTISDIIPSVFPNRFQIVNEIMKVFILSLPFWVCRDLLDNVMCTKEIEDVLEYLENTPADELCELFVKDIRPSETKWTPMTQTMMYCFFVLPLLDGHNCRSLLRILLLLIFDENQKYISKIHTKELVSRLQSELGIDCLQEEHYEKKYIPDGEGPKKCAIRYYRNADYQLLRSNRT